MIIDLFAGPGGWDEGLRLLGRGDVRGLEMDEAACATAEVAGHARQRVTLGEPPRSYLSSQTCNDVEGIVASPPCQGFSMAGSGLGRLDGAALLTTIELMGRGWQRRGVRQRTPDELIDNMRKIANDSRSALVLEPLRWVLDLRPEWTCWEQVPTVLPLWEACAEVLRADGYAVWTGKVHAEQYGVPQTRTRAVLVAKWRRYAEPSSDLAPVPTHSRFHTRDRTRLDPGVLPWVSMAEALGHGMTERPGMTVTGGGTATGGAEPFGNGARQSMRREYDAGRWQPPGDAVRFGNQDHSAVRAIDEPAATIRYSARMNASDWVMGTHKGAGMLEAAGQHQGERALDEPAFTITGADGGGSKRLSWQPRPGNDATADEDMAWTAERPSPTIVGSFAPDVVAAPGYRKAGDGPRQAAKGSVRVTVQEAAVLQSFPADYPWQGSKTKQYQQVGNAIPVRLAEAILRRVL